MEYKVKFRITLEGRTLIDTIVVDAENETEALKKVKENTLGNPKIVSIKEQVPEVKPKPESRVQLSKQESKIAKDTFKNTLEVVFCEVVKLDPLRELEEVKFSTNRIIVRLAEMFEDEVESNY